MESINRVVGAETETELMNLTGSVVARQPARSQN